MVDLIPADDSEYAFMPATTKDDTRFLDKKSISVLSSDQDTTSFAPSEPKDPAQNCSRDFSCKSEEASGHHGPLDRQAVKDWAALSDPIIIHRGTAPTAARRPLPARRHPAPTLPLPPLAPDVLAMLPPMRTPPRPRPPPPPHTHQPGCDNGSSALSPSAPPHYPPSPPPPPLMASYLQSPALPESKQHQQQNPQQQQQQQQHQQQQQQQMRWWRQQREQWPQSAAHVDPAQPSDVEFSQQDWRDW
jgi:hypothetical protein